MVRDLTCAIVLLAIAGAYYVLASGIGRSALADEVGPAGLPIAYATLLAALGLALAVKTLVAAKLTRADVSRAGKSQPAFVLLRAAGALGIGALYVALVSWLGYWLSLLLLLPAMAAYQGTPFSRKMLLISVLGATAFWCIFVWLLGIPMPQPWFLTNA